MGQRCQFLEDLVDRGGLSRAHVENAPGAVLQGGEAGVDGIGHIEEVPGLRAVPVDPDFLILEHGLGEDGHDAGFPLGVLARAIDVGEAQDGAGKVVGLPVQGQMLFDGQLVGGVVVLWVDRILFR